MWLGTFNRYALSLIFFSTSQDLIFRAFSSYIYLPESNMMLDISFRVPYGKLCRRINVSSEIDLIMIGWLVPIGSFCIWNYKITLNKFGYLEKIDPFLSGDKINFRCWWDQKLFFFVFFCLVTRTGVFITIMNNWVMVFQWPIK